MPIYEYQCLKCGSHFEQRQTVSDEPLRTCEKCGGGLEKQWSLSGFQFKGEGWYVTDYAGKKDGKPDLAKTAEKTSTVESTAATDTASKPKSEPQAPGKTDTGAKKD